MHRYGAGETKGIFFQKGTDYHLLLNGTQIRQKHSKAHGYYEDKDTAQSLPQAPQKHSIEGGDVRPEASGVEVHIVKVPVYPSTYF